MALEQFGYRNCREAAAVPVINFRPIAPGGCSRVDDTRVALLTRDGAPNGNDMPLSRDVSAEERIILRIGLYVNNRRLRPLGEVKSGLPDVGAEIEYERLGARFIIGDDVSVPRHIVGTIMCVKKNLRERLCISAVGS